MLAFWNEEMSARYLTAILLLSSSALFSLGIDWGLPHTHAWHGDSMCHTTLRAMADHFSGFTKYPPVQHVILAVAFSPYIGWLFLRGELDLDASSMQEAFADPVASMTVLIVITRLVGIAMAVGTVALIVRILRRLGADTGSACMAGALFALCSEVGFFAKLAMVDGPMLFWFAAALSALVELTRTWKPRTGAWLGVLVALGICTKEQIAGAWVLPPLALLILAFRCPRHTGSPAKALLAGLLAWVLSYGFASKLFIDPSGWAERIQQWLGEGTSAELWGGHPNTPSGHALLLRDTALEMLNAMGPGLFSLALGLSLLALLRRAPGSWLLALSFLSYDLFTLVSLRYVKTRFILPMVLLLAILAGLGLASWPRRQRRWAQCGASLVLFFGLLRCLHVVQMMAADPRYEAEAFLAQTLRPGDSVEAYADDPYLPRMHVADLHLTHVAPGQMTTKALGQRAPKAIVLAPAYHWKLTASEREYIHWLQEESGYRRHTFRGAPAPQFLSADSATVLLPTIHILVDPGLNR